VRALAGLIVLAIVAIACNDELVEAVAPEVCGSGKRWIGGKRGSELMYPGRDCVGCHLRNDGPELAFGGTVYPFVFETKEEYDAAQSGHDCFGVEGVRVVIQLDDGSELETVTNEAGNFFIEGRQSDVPMPFRVRVAWEAGGLQRETTMTTAPSYGGCARCHGYQESEEAFDATPPPDFVADDVPWIGLPGNPGQLDAPGG
jgi:cytochrome c553